MKEKSSGIKLFERVMKSDAQSADLKKINEQLQKQYEFIEKLLDSTMEFVNVFDMDLTYLTINKKTEIVLIKDKSEIIGKNFKDLFPEYLESDYYKNLCGAAKGYTISESRSFGPSGKQYITSFIPLVENGSQYGVLVVARNVTDQIGQEKKLGELTKKLTSQNKEILLLKSELDRFADSLSDTDKQKLNKILGALKIPDPDQS